MKKFKTILKLFKLKLQIIWKIIHHKGPFCVLYISMYDLGRLVSNDTVNKVDGSYYRMMGYQMRQLLKNVGDNVDDVELICDKAQFMADIEQKLKNEKL